MADLILVIGEFGHTIDFTIQDNIQAVDISAFDSITLKILSSDFVTTSLTKTLAFVTDGTDGKVRWNVLTGEIPGTAAIYLGQIILLDTGTQTRKTQIFDIEVVRKLD